MDRTGSSSDVAVFAYPEVRCARLASVTNGVRHESFRCWHSQCTLGENAESSADHDLRDPLVDEYLAWLSRLRLASSAASVSEWREVAPDYFTVKRFRKSYVKSRALS